ncbi:MAG: hypothetical protein KatS3mg022_3579 [Armatimonadota bacterium]|nr:MAG: hypothetical protein KatS3mg022_3579 [Armatimonadota bacterium]GIV20503.1 MAG: hypothetical protein KatS3mg023_2254 [Armatimonadota bacterium]GIV22095.1 MAG: hypothetical protein KatS3mg023_3846 [Armatimonadota bacterium]
MHRQTRDRMNHHRADSILVSAALVAIVLLIDRSGTVWKLLELVVISLVLGYVIGTAYHYIVHFEYYARDENGQQK